MPSKSPHGPWESVERTSWFVRMGWWLGGASLGGRGNAGNSMLCTRSPTCASYSKWPVPRRIVEARLASRRVVRFHRHGCWMVHGLSFYAGPIQVLDSFESRSSRMNTHPHWNGCVSMERHIRPGSEAVIASRTDQHASPTDLLPSHAKDGDSCPSRPPLFPHGPMALRVRKVPLPSIEREPPVVSNPMPSTVGKLDPGS
eukprot:scaffold172_cov341-Pavlova_lutheri.AAC.9